MAYDVNMLSARHDDQYFTLATRDNRITVMASKWNERGHLFAKLFIALNLISHLLYAFPADPV